MLAAYRGAVAAVARAGINVIVDEVLLSEAGWTAWQHELAGLEVVAVTSDLEVLERHDRDRTDRLIRLARSRRGGGRGHVRIRRQRRHLQHGPGGRCYSDPPPR